MNETTRNDRHSLLELAQLACLGLLMIVAAFVAERRLARLVG